MHPITVARRLSFPTLASDQPVNRNSLQRRKFSPANLKQEGSVMVIYPVPTAVTQARVQLAVDQEAKAPPATIQNDVVDLIEVQAEAERELLLDLKA
jgi:hypothetical protein